MSNKTTPPQIIHAQGEPVGALDKYWLDTARDTARESIKAIEDAAKQLIPIASLAQTIYFAAVSFSNVKKAFAFTATEWRFAIAAVLALPLLFWIASLIFAIGVFTPAAYKTNLESPDIAREMYQRMVAYKHRMLRWAHWLFVLGLVPLAINLILYVALIPVPPESGAK